MNHIANYTPKEPAFGTKSKTSSREEHADAARRASWVLTRTEVAVDCKQTISRHAATHLIEYGFVVQMGPGTTFARLTDEIVALQVQKPRSLDLIVMTTNMDVVSICRKAKEDHAGILQTMQVVLTGGSVQAAINSLVGPYAVEGIRSEKIRPNVLFFGAAGLSFKGGLSLRYQFDDELATQETYATRSTDCRVLLCDHTKFGRNFAWKAGLTIHGMLETTDRFYIISSYPTDRPKEQVLVDQEVAAFDELLNDLAKDPRLRAKEFALRLVSTAPGEGVAKELSLSERRKELGLDGDHPHEVADAEASNDAGIHSGHPILPTHETARVK